MADTVSETYIYDLASTVSPLAAGDKIIIEKASGGTKAMTYAEFIKAVAASMVTNAGTVTDDIHSVSGKQLNPNVSGTLAASIASLNSSKQNMIGSATQITAFPYTAPSNGFLTLLIKVTADGPWYAYYSTSGMNYGDWASQFSGNSRGNYGDFKCFPLKKGATVTAQGSTNCTVKAFFLPIS